MKNIKEKETELSLEFIKEYVDEEGNTSLEYKTNEETYRKLEKIFGKPLNEKISQHFEEYPEEITEYCSKLGKYQTDTALE